jgi:hypothetical protein
MMTKTRVFPYYSYELEGRLHALETPSHDQHMWPPCVPTGIGN